MLAEQALNASMSEEKSIQSLGGKARAEALSEEQRKNIARRAASARWAKKSEAPNSDLPYSMFRGTVGFGPTELECHVLSDGKRVFTQREIVRILSGGTESGNLNRYLERNPLITNIDNLGPVIQFSVSGSNVEALGREATTLVEICEKYLEAADQGLLKGSQKKLAAQASIVIRACAKVGIIALIDEATGYQRVRQKNALQLKLQAFIAEDLQEWARVFPEEFWLELARLEGIRYSARNRPLRWGRYIMMFVYDAIDKDVGRRLREKNPNPRHRKNHHQWLKKFGREKVHDQIQKVVTIMKLCNDMDDFRTKFARVFQKAPAASQLSFEDIDWGMQSK